MISVASVALILRRNHCLHSLGIIYHREYKTPKVIIFTTGILHTQKSPAGVSLMRGFEAQAVK
jgi:hypothetical protein